MALPTGLSMSATLNHCTAAIAPGPVISNLANDVWSTRATPSRTARCSLPTCVNQFGSVNDGRSTASTPSGANHNGRSQPPRLPNTARCDASVSCNGLRRMPRAVTFSDPGAASL